MSFTKSQLLHSLKLCLVTQQPDGSLEKYAAEKYAAIVCDAVRGGVTSVQLRYKGNDLATFFHLGIAIKDVLTRLSIPLIVNDNVLLAKAIDAEGVHLGAMDTSPLEARSILGASKVIGLTVDTFDALEAANQLDCIDYVGIGAIFNTATKTCRTVWGIEHLKKAVLLSRHPGVASGGIDEDNIGSVYATGVSGIAVISAIYNASDPAEAARMLIYKMAGA